jgi:polyhydroxyalkanoate synthesis regulator phasin
MMDRYTARALVEQGQMSSEEYLRLFGEEIRSAREAHKAEEAQRKRELAAQAAKAGQEEAGQGSQRGPSQPVGRSDDW